MSFVENTVPFFADFGVQALLDAAPVRGIFDDAWTTGAVGIGMATTMPAFFLPSAHAGASPVGQTLTLLESGAVWRVAATEPDGTGMTRLLLERP